MTFLFRLALFILGMTAPALADCGRADLIATMDATDRAALLAQSNAHPYPEGNLWQAETDTSLLHIVGTFHLYDPRILPMIEQVTPLIESADAIYAEASLDDLARVETELATNTGLMFIQEGPTMPDLLSPEDWTALTAAMGKRGIPAVFAAKMQPWFLALNLAIPPCALAGMAQEKGLDFHLLQAAKTAGIAGRSLEDPLSILNILARAPLEEQMTGLRLGLRMDGNPAYFTTTTEAYFAGRHRALWEFNRNVAFELFADEVPDFAAMFEQSERDLLIDRNHAWIDRLLPEAARGRYVIAVGAAHLSGEDGLLQLLENNGYTLTRLD